MHVIATTALKTDPAMDDAFLRDLFASVGPISIKRMFGGQGIYVDGIIIAALQADRLMVKGDDLCSVQYEAVGMERWAYKKPKTDKASYMPYWQVPESALDDPDEMAVWAQMALDAAIRSSEK